MQEIPKITGDCVNNDIVICFPNTEVDGKYAESSTSLYPVPGE